MQSALTTLGLSAAALIGCGGSSEPSTPDAGPCWSTDRTTPGGTLELGTGGTDWIEMPSTLALRQGSQGAGFLFVNARIQGLDGGDPTNFLAENNPRTRVTGTLMTGETFGDQCPSRQGYASNADGWEHWAAGQMLVFLPFSIETKANNTDVVITMEIIDSAGHYAKSEKTVFVTPRMVFAPE